MSVSELYITTFRFKVSAAFACMLTLVSASSWLFLSMSTVSRLTSPLLMWKWKHWPMEYLGRHHRFQVYERMLDPAIILQENQEVPV